MNYDSTITVALITGCVTILGIIVKDFFIHWRNEKNKEKKKIHEVFHNYADPLSKSAESFFWRLNEILHDQSRYQYLIRRDNNTTFEEYKYVSTLYRLASLLGWIRAIRREISYLKPTRKSQLIKLSNSIANIEGTLADGQSAEKQRMDKLLSVLGITPSADIVGLSTELDSFINNSLRKDNHDHIRDLSMDEKETLFNSCISFLCNRFRVTTPDPDNLKKSLPDGIKLLSIREAYIYRDWQEGIGDLMLVPSNNNNRDYDIIGFREFENLFTNKVVDDRTWLRRIEILFKDLDLHQDTTTDLRAFQLKSLFDSIALLIVSLSQSGLKRTPLTDNTILKARSVLNPNL